MGLKYIHSLGLVHLDIKPSELCLFHCFSHAYTTQWELDLHMFTFPFFLGNIFICRRPSSSAGGEGDSEEEDESPSGVVYKIGTYLSMCFTLKCINDLPVLIIYLGL